MVRIDIEMMSGVTIGERLSRRAVVKEQSLRRVFLKREDRHQYKT